MLEAMSGGGRPGAQGSFRKLRELRGPRVAALAVVMIASAWLGCGCACSAMSLPTHAAVGACVGQAFADEPILALSAGLASHALVDMLPHYDYDDDIQALLAVVGIALMLDRYAREGYNTGLILGAIGGVLPDLEGLLRRKTGYGPRIFASHTGALKHGSTPSVYKSLLLEAGLIGMAVCVRF